MLLVHICRMSKRSKNNATVTPHPQALDPSRSTDNWRWLTTTVAYHGIAKETLSAQFTTTMKPSRPIRSVLKLTAIGGLHTCGYVINLKPKQISRNALN